MISSIYSQNNTKIKACVWLQWLIWWWSHLQYVITLIILNNDIENYKIAWLLVSDYEFI